MYRLSSSEAGFAKGKELQEQKSLELARKFANNPFIEKVDASAHIHLMPEFRNKLYEAWLSDPRIATVENLLLETGLGSDVEIREKSKSLIHSFRRRLKKENSADAKAIADNPHVERIDASGCIRLKSDFKKCLYEAWLLEQTPATIDKLLIKAGLGYDVTGISRKSETLHQEFMERQKREFFVNQVLDQKAIANNPNVERVDATGAIHLTSGFKEQLYEAWLSERNSITIEKLLREAGLGREATGKRKSLWMHEEFMRQLKGQKQRKQRKSQHQPKEQKVKIFAGRSEIHDVVNNNGTRLRDEMLEANPLKFGIDGVNVKNNDTEKAGQFSDVIPVFSPASFSENLNSTIKAKLAEGVEGTNIAGFASEIASMVLESLKAQVAAQVASAAAQMATASTTSTIPIAVNIKNEEAAPAASAADKKTEKFAEVAAVEDGSTTAVMKAALAKAAVVSPASEPSEHPYIIKKSTDDDSEGSYELSPTFYNDAKILSRYYDIKTILGVCGLASFSWIDPKQTLQKITHWTSNNVRVYDDAMFSYRVRGNRTKLMETAADDFLGKIKASFKKLRPNERKEICLWISRLPQYPGEGFTTTQILEKCGITKSAYHNYVTVEEHGLRVSKRREDDTNIVRAAFDYEGFHRGTRQVFMLIPRLNPAKKLSYRRVCSIMKEAGMDCGIRRSKNRGESFMDKNKKPNILRRRFHMFRPNQVRVTDVTYLYLKNGVKAYGSALMDPVTGRLIAFNVSNFNDLELVMETLRLSDTHPCEDGGIFHSDQGVLYHTDDFQKEVLLRNLNQSMSDNINNNLRKNHRFDFLL